MIEPHIEGQLTATADNETTKINFTGNDAAIVAIMCALKNRFPNAYEVFLIFQGYEKENNKKAKAGKA